MTRPATALVIAAALAAAAAPGAAEVLRPAGGHNDSAHRYFPDLDARLNAVRYARWRALELALLQGITPQLDQEYSAYLLGLIAAPPRYAPEPELIAPILSRDATPVYRALWWGGVLETQLIDALAAADATEPATNARLEKALAAYRAERWALQPQADESAPAPEASRLAPSSANILQAGTALFVESAQALAASSYGEQRQLVRKVVEDFDKSFASERPAHDATYAAAAPDVTAAWPDVADALDRLARYRAEVFEALAPAGDTLEGRRLRDDRLRAVASRWGLSR
jgi:hypothetical protein